MSHFKVASILVFWLFSLMSSVGSAQHSEECKDQFKSLLSKQFLDADDVFIGLDVSYRRSSLAGTVPDSEIRIRQYSKDVIRVDLGPKRVVVLNGKLSFEAIQSKGEWVFVDVGFGANVRQKIMSLFRSKVEVATFTTRLGRQYSDPIDDSAILSAEWKQEKSGGRIMHVVLKQTADLDPIEAPPCVLSLELDPDNHLFTKHYSIVFGDLNGREVAIPTVLARKVKRFEDGEKCTLVEENTIFENLGDSFIPKSHLNRIYSWTLISSAEFEDELDIFTPESLGLKTPRDKSANWLGWVILSAIALILASIFLRRSFLGTMATR